MKRIATVSLGVLLCAGCASSGPVQVGPDTYLISKQSAGGLFVTGNTVKADLLKEGSAFCASKGKDMEVVSAEGNNAIPFVRTSNAEVQIKCIPRAAQ